MQDTKKTEEKKCRSVRARWACVAFKEVESFLVWRVGHFDCSVSTKSSAIRDALRRVRRVQATQYTRRHGEARFLQKLKGYIDTCRNIVTYLILLIHALSIVMYIQATLLTIIKAVVPQDWVTTSIHFDGREKIRIDLVIGEQATPILTNVDATPI